MSRAIRIKPITLAFCTGLLASTASADTLVTHVEQITSTSSSSETRPHLGNDGAGDLVVYTSCPDRPEVSGAVSGPGYIFYQRLVGGAASGEPVQVTSGPPYAEGNDVFGDNIVYSLYDSPTTSPFFSGAIMAYEISTGSTATLGQADVIGTPRIHGNRVVWSEGDVYAKVAKYFELPWLEFGYTASKLAGPTPPAYGIEIGDSFVVWATIEDDGQYDLHAYDYGMAMQYTVTNTPDVDEIWPVTTGSWIVWEQDAGGVSTIEALNVVTLTAVTVANNGAGNWQPSADGDLVAWVTDVAGDLDVWVYRFSTGEAFAVTSDPGHQYLPEVFGNLIAYVDYDASEDDQDIYVSTLSFVPDEPCVDLGGDTDIDGVCDDADNCPDIPNSDQSDADADGVGDICDPTPTGEPPVADAGPDQTVHVGDNVTLDGTASSDPNDNYPLTYVWTLYNSGTTGVTELTGPAPSFTADLTTPYTADLYVIDSEGRVSETDSVVISTTNSPPVADAGPDQAIDLVGMDVTLDGSHSYDVDGDAFNYAWSLTEKPTGSSAELVDAQTAHPSFTADVNGEYRATLVVNDGWTDSEADDVVVSFNNVAPVADAGGNQAVAVGDTVTLAGSGTDANGDALTYQWSFVSRPDGSAPALAGATEPTASFVADAAGTYVLSLVVKDGIAASESANVSILATTSQDEIVHSIGEIIDDIGLLPPDIFKNKNLAKALTNQLLAVIDLVEAGDYDLARDKLVQAVIPKTNGCADSGSPDKNDWIETCAEQGQIYPLLQEAVALLEQMIGG